jgi:ubiquinone/menaquinone biosynthesis C-methylase UbiE
MVGAAGKVYAADSDAKAIKALVAQATRRGLNNVDARACSAADIDFIPSASADFVLAHGLLCCMTDHRGALGQIKRILKPEGTAYLSVSKMAPRKDRRTVGREEWRAILAEFKVLGEGDGLTARWGYVLLAQH